MAPSSSKLPPCLQLKALRERANLTGAACGKMLPKRDGSPGVQTTYFRYEDAKKMGDAKINYHVIEKLIPLFVGRGTPPITIDEMIAVSVASNALAIRHSRSDAHEIAREAMPVAAKLVVRHRAERGVWMDEDTMRDRTFGASTMSADEEVEGEQFVVAVTDDHALPRYPAGTMLKCVDPNAVQSAHMSGRRVLVRITKPGMGLTSFQVGTHGGFNGNSVSIMGFDGRPLKGDVVGVVIGSYQKEG